MGNFTRRGLIATAMATAAGSALVASAYAQPAGHVGGNLPDAWDVECDVLCIGGGCAGMSAAYAAAEAGAEVILLESMPSTQMNSTYFCMGNFNVVGSDEQAAMGIEDSPEAYLEDFMNLGRADYPTPETWHNVDAIRRYAEHTVDAYRLLKDWGLEFPDPISATGNTIVRCHALDNRHMMDLLTEHAAEVGADIRYNTEFTELIVDGDGAVLGAFAVDASGNEIAVKARKATVLATGPFMRNKAMMEECMPGVSEVDVVCGLGAYGAGHLAAEKMGATMWGRNNLYLVGGYDPYGTLAYTELCQFGAIDVNMQGNRYCNDGNHWSYERSQAVINQGINPETGTYFSWVIIDQAMYDEAMKIGAPLGLTEETAALFKKADTIEELAEIIGAPELPATVARYNDDLAKGRDTAFGRVYRNGPGTGDPIPLENPPFYAWAERPCALLSPTIGFITDENNRLLDVYGKPLGGGRLFACGELTERTVTGNKYLVGSAISYGTTMGLLIGEDAAALESWE